MKHIVAIIKPFLVERVLEGLRRSPLEAIWLTEVKGVGKQKSYLDHYTDSEYSHGFLPKVELTLLVDDQRAEEVVERLIEISRTGRMGDGKILVLPANSYEKVIDIASV